MLSVLQSKLNSQCPTVSVVNPEMELQNDEDRSKNLFDDVKCTKTKNMKKMVLVPASGLKLSSKSPLSGYFSDFYLALWNLPLGITYIGLTRT